MEQQGDRPNDAQAASAGDTPVVARRMVLAGVALVLAGAIYLIAVRGEAILVDLSVLGAKVFCF